MQKTRLAAIEYIRGIAMLGVISVHVCAQYLNYPSSNIQFVALLEIVPRFSLPIFFFISAFGLFYNMDSPTRFDYKRFMHRRFKTVLIPYMVWSTFYIFYYTILSHNFPLPDLKILATKFFFGDASYHLYFLVLLLWFYLLMPLWITIIHKINAQILALLLIFQLAFNHFSLYWLHPESIQQPLLHALLDYRFNYWVLHYLFIFILGGWLSIHLEDFRSFMQSRRRSICVFFWASMSLLVGYYYYLLFQMDYTPLEAVNTAHQLSPAGLFYSIGASIFFFTVFSYQRPPYWLNALLTSLGQHSYFIYLIHPALITASMLFLQAKGILMTVPMTICFYFAIILLSIVTAILFRRLGNIIPLINILTIGNYPKQKRPTND